MTLQLMELGEPDASGRRRPVAIDGKTEYLELDSVIMAIGQKLDGKDFENTVELTQEVLLPQMRIHSLQILTVYLQLAMLQIRALQLLLPLSVRQTGALRLSMLT